MAVPSEPHDRENVLKGAGPARQPRPSVMLSATVEHFGGEPTKHRVRDLSAGGMRIDQAGSIKRGATVLVTVGSLHALGATVVWVSDGSAGLSFTQAINPDDAKAKVAVGVPRPIAPINAVAPTAGWAYDLRNPYRRQP